MNLGLRVDRLAKHSIAVNVLNDVVEKIPRFILSSNRIKCSNVIESSRVERDGIFWVNANQSILDESLLDSRQSSKELLIVSIDKLKFREKKQVRIDGLSSPNANERVDLRIPSLRKDLRLDLLRSRCPVFESVVLLELLRNLS